MKSFSGIMDDAGKGLRRVFYLDLRMLACFRIGLGGMILADLFQRSLSFKAHYGQSGVMPAGEALWYADFSTLLPLHIWFPTDPAQVFLFLIHGLAAVALMLGVQTRWATVICWVLVNSLQLRNPIILYGADRELAALLLWAIFLPLGGKWSLDARQRYRWANVRRVSGWAAAGLILQVGVIYFTSVLSKSGETWRDGSAILLALHVDAYTGTFGRWLLPFGEYLKVLTFTTWIIEGVAPFLLLAGKYERIRLLACLALMGMQCGFLVFLSVGLFPWISIVALVALIPVPLFSSNTPATSEKTFNMRWAEACAGLLVIMMLGWQAALVSLQFQKSVLLGKLPDALAWGYKVTRLAQSWSMFSPDPPDRDGWFVMEWSESDSVKRDLLRGGAVLDWKKPQAVNRMFPSERWKEWMQKVHLRGLKWESTVDYFVQEDSRRSSDENVKQTVQVRLWYLEESYHSPGQPPARRLLFEKSFQGEFQPPDKA